MAARSALRRLTRRHAKVSADHQWLTKPLPKLLIYAHPGSLIRQGDIEWCRALKDQSW